MSRNPGLALATLVLAAVAACSPADDGVPPGPAASPSASAPAGETGTASPGGAGASPSASGPEAPGTTITTGSSEFGEILFDGAGQSIYIWEVETSEEPRCYDDCAAAWPPVVSDGSPVAGGGVDPALLGTTPRDDGSTQVTYNGHPLYYYAHEAPGEVKCHDISTHGGLWWVVLPTGDRAP